MHDRVGGGPDVPGVQLTMPPLARVRVVTRRCGRRCRVARPPVAPVAVPGAPMKSAWIVIRRLAGCRRARRAVETCSSSGRAGRPGPRSRCRRSGRAACRAGRSGPARPRPASSRSASSGCSWRSGAPSYPGSSTLTMYMPGHGPCGIGQLNVSVDGSSASYDPSGLVVTVVNSRQLFGVVRQVHVPAGTGAVDPGVDADRDAADRPRLAVPRRLRVALEVDVVEDLADEPAGLRDVTGPGVGRVRAVGVGAEVGHHVEVGVGVLAVLQHDEALVAQRCVRAGHAVVVAARSPGSTGR